MDFNDTPEEAAFRAEVRAWLAENCAEYKEPPKTPWPEDEMVRRGRAWLAKKATAGYATITWPKEVGGLGGTKMQETIFAQEQAKYHIPDGPFVQMGVNMAVPVIRRHGTPEQYEKFAGPTLRGELGWCQLFSEPSAGSDLANVRTRAVKQGDNWIVNGQKVWTSWAHTSHWGIMLARTDPSKSKHKGLTFFVVDMSAPGIEIRPIQQINQKAEFNEVFLTDVVVPDSMRIGAEGEGWACAMTVLMNERSHRGAPPQSYIQQLALKARDIQRENGTAALDSGDVRARLARWYAEEQGAKYFGYRVLTSLSRGEPPPPTAALVKLVQSSGSQQARAFEMDLDEFGGLFETSDRPHQDDLFDQYFWFTLLRIAGGADEILRGLLAEQGLKMPPEPRVDKDIPFDQLPA